MRFFRFAPLLASALVLPTALTGLGSPATESPEIVVTGVSGSASVVTNGTPARELRVFDRVANGSTITVEKGAWVYLVATPTGRRWRVEGNALVAVQAGQVKVVRGRLVELDPLAAPEAIAAIRLDDLGRLRMAGTRVRGGSDLSPNGVVLADFDHVELRCSAVPGATAYKIRVIDATPGGMEILSVRVVAAEGAIRVALAGGTLHAGRSYIWQAIAESEAGAVGFPQVREARFETLPENEVETLASLRRQAKGSTAPDIAFLLAAFEASHGLEEEACRTLRIRGLLATKAAGSIGCRTR